ncbi:MAG: histidine--tRNA ligase [Pseudomonadota bacterium]
MSQVRTVRGTHDLYGETMRRHRHVVDTSRGIAELYGYGEIETPILEFNEIFARTLGETSDVVNKEMYSFDDRGGDRLTLRPENTASIVRAVITNGLTQDLPIKLFYSGPMFRYERPQKGRQRQFHQIGVELIGAAEPAADIEVIALASHVLKALGLGDQVVLELNSLGDLESRAAYRETLVAYLSDHRESLSKDSQDRLERNPMRILDSKDEGDRQIVRDAPRMVDSFNDASRAFFDEVCGGLDLLGVTYTRNDRLVRGLDYYTHTAFEFTTTALGAQGTVIAGGRYDGLMKQIGGPDRPGIGWAGGIERLGMLLEAEPPASRPIAIVPIGDAAQSAASALAMELRHAGLPVELAFKGKPGQRMKRADRLSARFALSLGDDELAQGTVQLRDLDSGETTSIKRASVVGHLRNNS